MPKEMSINNKLLNVKNLKNNNFLKKIKKLSSPYSSSKGGDLGQKFVPQYFLVFRVMLFNCLN